MDYELAHRIILAILYYNKTIISNKSLLAPDSHAFLEGRQKLRETLLIRIEQILGI